MVIRRVVAPRIDFSGLRRELNLPNGYPLGAQAEADTVAASPPPLPSIDRTDIAFATLDPPGSMDLDQAMCLQRRAGGGYRVYYAIADVSAYVRPDGDLAAETWKRGQTVYLPDGKVPLHPFSLSEGAASLLPGQRRAAVLWVLDLDAHGGLIATHVERATVRSRARLDYPRTQAAMDAGILDGPIGLLPEIGSLLLERGLSRGAISLPIPAQEVEPVDGGWELVLAAPRPIEEYNAQISLLTGMAAAKIMLAGKVGLLRTMPRPLPVAVAGLRTAAASLGIDWPEGISTGRVIAGVDAASPRGAAFLDHAAELMRGAGYAAFDGAVPAASEHGAVAAPYAHVTAPLRRLADRYATEICLALYAGRPVPDWARSGLSGLPEVMSATDRRAAAASHGAVDLTEAVLLEHRVGELFDAVVLDVDEPHRNGGESTGGAERPRQTGGEARRALVVLDEPPVRARCEGDQFVPGTRIRVRLVVADPNSRRVLFQKAE